MANERDSYNYESDVSKLLPQNQVHGGGPLVFRDIVEAWKKDGLSGIEIDGKKAGPLKLPETGGKKKARL